MDKETKLASNVFNIQNYLLKKRITGFTNTTHNRAIDRLVRKLNIQLEAPSKVDKNLTLQFHSESQITNALFRMTLPDLIKIKVYNQNNKIIENFFNSLAGR